MIVYKEEGYAVVLSYQEVGQMKLEKDSRQMDWVRDNERQTGQNYEYAQYMMLVDVKKNTKHSF